MKCLLLENWSGELVLLDWKGSRGVVGLELLSGLLSGLAGLLGTLGLWGLSLFFIL